MSEITVPELYAALRLGNKDDTIPTDLTAQLTRLLMATKARVESYARNADQAIKNEAIIRYSAWLYDSHRDDISNPHHFKNSGARDFLAPYRSRQLVSIE